MKYGRGDLMHEHEGLPGNLFWEAWGRARAFSKVASRSSCGGIFGKSKSLSRFGSVSFLSVRCRARRITFTAMMFGFLRVATISLVEHRQIPVRVRHFRVESECSLECDNGASCISGSRHGHAQVEVSDWRNRYSRLTARGGPYRPPPDFARAAGKQLKALV